MYLHCDGEAGFLEYKGLLTRFTLQKSNRKKGGGRIDTYLESISTAVSWN